MCCLQPVPVCITVLRVLILLPHPNLQASYLVGVSDPNSQSGHQGLVDPIQFARANQAIQMACQNLVDPASSPSQVRMKYTHTHAHTQPLTLHVCEPASDTEVRVGEQRSSNLTII